MILEVGKFYKTHNGWKVKVLGQNDVNEFVCSVTDIDGDERGKRIYERNGCFFGMSLDYAHSIKEPWFDASPSGSKDIDGWGIDEFRSAINKSGLFPW